MKKNYLLISALSLGVTLMSYGQSAKQLNIYQGTPVIDGIVDDLYGDISVNTLTNRINSSDACDAPQGPEGKNTATVGAAWDDDYIYLIMKVIDNTPKGTEDAAEFFIALTPNSQACDPQAGVGVGGIYFAQTLGTDGAQISYRATAGTVGRDNGVVDNEAIKYAISETSDGYIAELSINITAGLDVNDEFSGLGFLTNWVPELGKEIAIDFANADNISGPGKAQLMWNACCGNRNWALKEQYGIGKLVPSINSVNKLSSLINNVTLAPNPAADNVDVIINAKSQDQVSVSIINSLSQKVYTQNFNTIAGETKNNISTSNLANGIYTVVISKNGLNATEKLVINR